MIGARSRVVLSALAFSLAGCVGNVLVDARVATQIHVVHGAAAQARLRSRGEPFSVGE